MTLFSALFWPKIGGVFFENYGEKKIFYGDKKNFYGVKKIFYGVKIEKKP